MRWLACLSLMVVFGMGAAQAGETPQDLPHAKLVALEKQLAVGDLVFIHVSALPFEKVSEATQSWANHVGVVVDVSGKAPVIAESRILRSGTASFARFVARSKADRVAVMRLNKPLDEAQQLAIKAAAERRMGVFYDTGFDLGSKREFCSRFVREVLIEAAGVEVGEVESFRSLLAHNPKTDQSFWRVWFFGKIPWERKTVTPASELNSPMLRPVFDGVAS